MKTRFVLACLITVYALALPLSSIAQKVHWKKMKNPIEQTPNSIQKFGKYLFMTTLQSSFLVSDDDGKSWIERFNLRESSILPQKAIGSSIYSDSTMDIVISDGGFYLTRLMSSTNFGINWSPLNGTTLHRMSIRSFCKWDSGFVVCGYENGSESSPVVYIINIFAKNKQTIMKRFSRVFALDKIFAVGDSGIYVSRNDSVDFKRILDFSSIGDSTTVNYENGIAYVTSGKYIFKSNDKGKSWRKDSVPFIIKHFQRSKKHFYAVDSKKRLWKADVNDRKWGVLLNTISSKRDITCLYVEDKQIIFGIKYEGIKRYSIELDKWIDEEIQIPSVTPYNVKISDEGIYAFPLYSSSTLFSGYCRSTDLGNNWKICHIAPYGMRYARISNKTKYYNRIFHDFDVGYNMCYAFSEYLGLGNIIPMVLPERDNTCKYTFVLKYEIMYLSTKLDSITVSKNKLVLLKHKTNFPFESISDQYGNTIVDIFTIADTVLCHKSNDSNSYYSVDYGKNWSRYNNWRNAYGKSVTILQIGEKYLSVEKSGVIRVFNKTTQSWNTIHDTLPGRVSVYDYDYNDSLFVMSNENGVFYITSDDLSEITSVEEMPNKIESNFIVSPLPFDETLSIALNNKNDNEPYTIILYDSMGRKKLVLANQTTEGIILDTGELNDGVYFIEISTNNTRKINKVIKIGR